jgi:dihydrofolate reductase
MGKLTFDISVSLDGYVAGPDPTVEEPLGEGGMGLHEWFFGLDAWRRSHGEKGGERSVDSEVIEETMSRPGAILMGRKMYSGGSGPWEDDPMANGWWGDDPPFGVPVFVLTHHPRDPLEMRGGANFNYITEGPEGALERAREVAGERDVGIGGGASVIQQYLTAGEVEEFQLHVVPLMLGAGTRLFEGVEPSEGYEIDRVIASPAVTHIRYRVER